MNHTKEAAIQKPVVVAALVLVCSGIYVVNRQPKAQKDIALKQNP